jgi:hypothetical protein
MTTTERDDVKPTIRRLHEQGPDRERRLRAAIEAERRLGSRRPPRRRSIGSEPDPRYAYLTHTHD